MVRKLTLAVSLMFGLSLVAAAAVPFARVEATSPGNFIVWIQNTESCTVNLVKILFREDVDVEAITINGPADTIVKFNRVTRICVIEVPAGLKPGAWLVLGITGAKATALGDVVKLNWAFTSPRCF